MKSKVLTLIIGILIGAILASAGFAIFINTNKLEKRPDFGAPPQMNQMKDSNQDGETPPELPNGETPNNNDNSATTQDNEQIQTNS